MLVFLQRIHGIQDAINWEERENAFKELLDQVRKDKPEGYNCIVPVSGGKDSTWQVYAMKKIHNMHRYNF